MKPTKPQRHIGARLPLTVALAAIMLLLFGVSASQAKVVVDAFGFPGPEGGHLNEPGGIAINQTGAGGVAPGTLYVSDDFEGGEGTAANRIQRLDPEGDFERLWGFNVLGPNEIQRVDIHFGAKGGALTGTVGGSFSLTLGGDTAEFPMEAPQSTSALKPSRQEVQSGLEALPSIGAGNVILSSSSGLDNSGGSFFEIEFTGALGGTDVEQLVFDPSKIVGPAPITTSISTLQDGFGGPFAGFEICTVASECKRGIDTPTAANGGQLSNPGAIAVNQSTGNLYVSDSGNRRLDEFDPNGNFLRAWGWDVVSTGGAGDVSTDAFEICTVAADCKKGVTSENGGAVGFAGSVLLDSSNHVWISDANNHRFEEFEPNGSFIAAYGWDVDALGGSGELEKCTSTAPGACQAGTVGTALGQFSGNPSAFAIDSAGFIYAIDRANDRIERFDPAMTSASLFAPDLLAEAGLSEFRESRILALPGGGFLLSAGQSDEYRLLELDQSGQLLEASLAGDGLRTVSGLARNEATGAIYASVSQGIAPGVAVIDDGPATPPTVAIDPPSGVEAEAATLNATLDPLGVPVANCKFQYSTDQVSWESVPEPGCASLDLEGGPQQLSETVAGLEPGTHYFARFTAGRFYNPTATATSGEEELTTPSLPPLLSAVGAAQVTDTSAYLAGEIKPRSQASEYHFAYGTTPALGSFTPTVELSGNKLAIVSRQVTGLQPETTYYLRLIATNVAGTTQSEPTSSFRTRPSLEPPPPCANQSLRTEQHSTFLPDCRAYEQVSPPEKNFANAEGSLSAADGDALFFGSFSGFGDPPGQVTLANALYRAARTAGGWRTRRLGELYCPKDPQASVKQGFPANSVEGFSPDFDFAALTHPEFASCPYPPLDPAAPLPQANLYRADYRSATIGYELLTPQPAWEPSATTVGGQYLGASEDWSHLAYASTGQQAPGAPSGNFWKLFEWHEGELKLVSVDPAGNPLSSDSMVPEDALHGVSGAGNRIFFTSHAFGIEGCESSTCEIYMRQNATKTFDVSQSECTSACGEGAADEFLAATPDGAKALFMSAARLTDEDTAGNGADLYLYTHSAKPASDKNLTLLSTDEEPADGTGAKVLGLLGISDDAQTAYFAAEGQLVAGAPTGAGPKLYRWRANGGSPTLDYLATLEYGERGNWAGSGTQGIRSAVRQITSDGERLILATAARLDRGADHDSDEDVYRFSQADGWLCLSCQAPAAPSAGGSNFFLGGATNQYAYAMSEDGGRVFFTSPDGLVPVDTNERQDVYEWREDGSLSLISSGTATRDVAFHGASAVGDDVFFNTYERLVGWDTDTSGDVYDARVVGGFPEPPPTGGAPCEGEACRGAPTSAPLAPGCGTCVFEAPFEKPKPHRCLRGKVRRHGKCVRKHPKSKKHHKHAHHRAADNQRRAQR